MCWGRDDRDKGRDDARVQDDRDRGIDEPGGALQLPAYLTAAVAMTADIDQGLLIMASLRSDSTNKRADAWVSRLNANCRMMFAIDVLTSL